MVPKGLGALSRGVSIPTDGSQLSWAEHTHCTGHLEGTRRRQHVQISFQSCRCFWLLGPGLVLKSSEMPVTGHTWPYWAHGWPLSDMDPNSVAVCSFVWGEEVWYEGQLAENKEQEDNFHSIPSGTMNYLGVNWCGENTKYFKAKGVTERRLNLPLFCYTERLWRCLFVAVRV